MMSSLFTGASGMTAHSKGMQVVSNNLANVNTIGFKQTMMLYQDMLSETVNTRSNMATNISQKGLGVRVGDTRRIYTQGSFALGNASTDVGIQGIGFFGVTKNGITQYTRAGNFRFTEDGKLMTHDRQWNVLGRPIVNGKPSGSAEPIALDFSTATGGVGYMPGKATTTVSAISQLGGMKDMTKNESNPYFAMVDRWDGTKTPPIGSGQYGYAEPIEIYDSQGQRREATIYYDFAGEKNGRKVLEYVIAMKPSDDASSRAGTEAAGLLMAGTVAFSSGGQLTNVTAFSPPASNNPKDLNGWIAAPIQNGSPVFTAAFSGASPQSIAFDIGLSLPESPSYTTAAVASSLPDGLYEATAGAKRRARASTVYGNSASSINQTRDGYAEGHLYNLHVGEDGIVTGQYSNGQSADLYQLSLFRFTSQDGLKSEGGNRFSATLESGEAQEGYAKDENFGSIQGGYLEQSNVDYAKEFTTMIITQRGFQMNSKVITTSDTMLQRALELKR